MATDVPDTRVQRLAEGFSSLMEEYNQLLARSRVSQRSLQDAKNQFERFVADRGTVTKQDLHEFDFFPTPEDIEEPLRRPSSQEKWWMRSDLPMTKRNLLRTRYAIDLVSQNGIGRAAGEDISSKMSSEVIANGSSAMPSISESPLEQDFTVPGTPSRLDCPFASMANRRLSAHAKSVMSRYRQSGTLTPRSSVSQVLVHSPTHAVPVSASKEEQCGALLPSSKPSNEIEASIQGSGPTCPIRFLEKSSPEEVAEYFEKHKHELPRSHEVCVRRFQSNEDSKRQLDAKYGNLVSMIQGLGQKHAPMLPDKGEGEDGQEEPVRDAQSTERVRQWASDVSNVKVRGEPDRRDDGGEADRLEDADDDEERKPHFDRPLKDVRVGESPSRPWGISVPLDATEKAEAKAMVEEQQVRAAQDQTAKPMAKCPFSQGGPPGMPNPHEAEQEEKKNADSHAKAAEPIFIAGPTNHDKLDQTTAGLTFTGPVFIGYSPEQAVAVLQALKGTGKQAVP